MAFTPLGYGNVQSGCSDAAGAAAETDNRFSFSAAAWMASLTSCRASRSGAGCWASSSAIPRSVMIRWFLQSIPAFSRILRPQAVRQPSTTISFQPV